MPPPEPADDDGSDDPSNAAPRSEVGATISVGDGGVARRLTSRCRNAAAVLLVAGATALLIAVLRSWDAVSAVLTVLAAGAVAGAVVLARRARLWARLGASSWPDTPGVPATIGQPRPLSPGVPGAPLRRRLGATVVPIQARADPQPGGGALIVHARGRGAAGTDPIALADADEVLIWSVGRAGLGSPWQHAGRFVIRRDSDGAVFLATTKLTDTW